MSPKKGQLIPPDAYPQLVAKGQAGEMARTLRSAVAAMEAARIIEDSRESLCEAVHAYVDQLEGAGQNFTLVSEKAHEIRGFAETAGMGATGRIADGLCHYFDDSQQAGLAPDAAVVALHVSAIVRVARDPNAQMSDTVAKELAVLASRKLAELRGRKRPLA